MLVLNTFYVLFVVHSRKPPLFQKENVVLKEQLNHEVKYCVKLGSTCASLLWSLTKYEIPDSTLHSVSVIITSHIVTSLLKFYIWYRCVCKISSKLSKTPWRTSRDQLQRQLTNRSFSSLLRPWQGHCLVSAVRRRLPPFSLSPG